MICSSIGDYIHLTVREVCFDFRATVLQVGNIMTA